MSVKSHWSYTSRVLEWFPYCDLRGQGHQSPFHYWGFQCRMIPIKEILKLRMNISVSSQPTDSQLLWRPSKWLGLFMMPEFKAMATIYSTVNKRTGLWTAWPRLYMNIWCSIVYIFFICITPYFTLLGNLVVIIFLYLVFMSLIVLYFLHNTSVLSFYIDVVLTLSMGMLDHSSHAISAWL